MLKYIRMKKLNLANLTLIVLAASCLLQAGAQLFAITVVAKTITQAPPRSFAILEGAYRYDSRAFWDTLPPINFLLCIIALVVNWKTARRKFIVFAFLFFIAGGLLAGFYLEPFFAEMIARGYSDKVDIALQKQATRWYYMDLGVWCLGLTAGLALLVALQYPGRIPAAPTAGNS